MSPRRLRPLIASLLLLLAAAHTHTLGLREHLRPKVTPRALLLLTGKFLSLVVVVLRPLPLPLPLSRPSCGARIDLLIEFRLCERASAMDFHHHSPRVCRFRANLASVCVRACVCFVRRKSWTTPAIVRILITTHLVGLLHLSEFVCPVRVLVARVDHLAPAHYTL